MPVYDYRVQPDQTGCEFCTNGFEMMRRLSDPPLTHCPKCQAPVIKIITAPALGRSKSMLDDRAKSAGFHKLKRVDHGAFEKLY
ncbi:MAG: zinc ribbon domain-containing protein [Kiritimatiellae bacterium]|nr:zinc ribbon domain-containing protein [Kiritimatiellia bacterium]